MSDKKTLTKKQTEAIAALLLGQTISQAANTAGVSRRTLTTWLASDEQFCAELRNSVRQILDSMVRRLTVLSDSAIDRLEDLLDDDKSAIQLRAVDIVLGRLNQLGQLHDLEQRIAALEGRKDEH